MLILNVIAFFIACIGIVLLFNLHPDVIGEDVERLFQNKEDLKTSTAKAKGLMKTPHFLITLKKIRTSLIAQGKEREFKIALTISFLLLLSGTIVGILLNNPFLSPVLSIALAIVPFWYLSHNLSIYERQSKEELETALSVVTSSYLLYDDLIEAVKENLSYIRPPVRIVFEEFVKEATLVRPDLVLCIRHMKEKIDDNTFHEYCDTLIRCQQNRAMKETLYAIVSKYTDLRVINSELETSMAKNKKEYIVMVFLTLGNIPMLKMLNEEWYGALVDTTLGKIVIAITALVVLVTYILCLYFTRPLEYGRSSS